MKRRRPKTRITPRDLCILDLLADYELLSTSQLLPTAFGEIDKSTALRRLRKLEGLRLIRRTHGLASGENVWSLTATGAMRISKESNLDKINRNNLEHDVAINDVRMALEKTGMINSWLTEQQIRRQAPRDHRGEPWDDVNPDAIFGLKVGNETKMVAFELEINGKSYSRYKKTFRIYSAYKTIWALWYFVPDRRMGEMLTRMWNKTNPQQTTPRFGYLVIQEVLKNPFELHVNSHGKILLVRSCHRQSAQSPAQGVGRQKL